MTEEPDTLTPMIACVLSLTQDAERTARAAQAEAKAAHDFSDWPIGLTWTAEVNAVRAQISGAAAELGDAAHRLSKLGLELQHELGMR